MRELPPIMMLPPAYIEALPQHVMHIIMRSDNAWLELQMGVAPDYDILATGAIPYETPKIVNGTLHRYNCRNVIHLTAHTNQYRPYGTSLLEVNSDRFDLRCRTEAGQEIRVNRPFVLAVPSAETVEKWARYYPADWLINLARIRYHVNRS